MTQFRASRSGYERALQFCRVRGLFAPGDRVLIGSGSGAASLGALGFLRLAQRDLGLSDIAVGAVDRGGAEDADAVADTGRFARQLGVTFYAISAEGRRVHHALLAVARQQKFRRVVLGHTRDDAVARILAHMTRTGDIDAIRPLVAKRRDGVVRPLLDLNESEALELARTAGIEPPMLPPDPHVRVPLELRLRRAVLPRLRVEVPGADDALLALGRTARELVRFVRDEAERRVAEAPMHGMRLELPSVSSPALASAMARSTLSRLGVAPSVARVAAGLLRGLLMPGQRANDSGEVVLGPGLVAAYVPDRRAVSIRVMMAKRAPGERIG